MPEACLRGPFGPITVVEQDGIILRVSWRGSSIADDTSVLRDAQRQLAEYFDSRREIFELTLRPAGSAFQRSVWTAMQEIPFGESRTYGDLAELAGGDPRSVGQACGSNPIAVIIPCHRVVGADGRLVGYSGGRGRETKARLLAHESRILGMPLPHGAPRDNPGFSG